jgi:uncharacterized protein (DUF433 family)
MMTVQQLNRITMDPEAMGGKPCIRGMRVTVGMIVEAMAAGRTNNCWLISRTSKSPMSAKL